MLAGVLLWLLVCAGFVGLEVAGVAEGVGLPVPLVAVLVLARALGECSRARRHSRAVTLSLAGLLAALALVARWLDLALPLLSPGETAAGLLGAAAVTLLLMPRAVRQALMPPLGLQPGSPVHAVTLVAGAATMVTSTLLFIALREEPAASLPFHATDSVVAVVTDAGLALAGVGFLLTRGARATAERLGVKRLGRRHAAWAVAAALAFQAAVGLAAWVESVLLPDLHALEDRFDYEFVGIPPLLGGVLVSLAAGVGEELLFRGALQPRVGIVASAVLFAALHVQYQLPGIVTIFAIGVALGGLRRVTSTTFTMLVHVVYDLGTFFVESVG